MGLAHGVHGVPGAPPPQLAPRPDAPVLEAAAPRVWDSARALSFPPGAPRSIAGSSRARPVGCTPAPERPLRTSRARTPCSQAPADRRFQQPRAWPPPSSPRPPAPGPGTSGALPWVLVPMGAVAPGCAGRRRHRPPGSARGPPATSVPSPAAWRPPHGMSHCRQVQGTRSHYREDSGSGAARVGERHIRTKETLYEARTTVGGLSPQRLLTAGPTARQPRDRAKGRPHPVPQAQKLLTPQHEPE